ncbi:MAG: exosortase/archaeosortase family protein [Candidatus Acidiferrales bacterium]
MSTVVDKSFQSAPKIGSRHAVFAVLLATSVALAWKPLTALVALCLHGDSYSHILLIPFIFLYLIYAERAAIFLQVRCSILPGLAVMLLGVAICWFVNPHFYRSNGEEHLSAVILGLVVIWLGAFVVCYGLRAARSALFPWLFLLLMVPLPDAILSRVIGGLQRGSVEISLLLFKICGVPVLRQGVILSVPGVTIEVAKECSSIRSSMALFITCLLAARFYLRTFWKQTLFVVLSLPLSVVKNGIRITTLTLLSLYVNPGFLHGDLHRDGGFVFFFLALAILWPVLEALRSSESPAASRAHEIQTDSQPIRG